MNSFNGAKEFHDPETASGSGLSHVPSQPLIFPSPRRMLSRDSGLPLDTRSTMGTSRNVFESQLAGEGPSSAFFENSLNLASYYCGLGSGTGGHMMEHGRGVRQEPQSSSIPTTRFYQDIATLNPKSHAGGTYSHKGMWITRDFRSRKCILENSRTPWNFKVGKSISRQKYVQISVSSHHYALDQRS